MSVLEKNIINRVLIKFPTLFRNNTGKGWVGKIISHTNNIITILNPRPLTAGLCVGSSDLIGWTPITITKCMIGHKIAIFTACEIKTNNLKPTKEQTNFINAIKKQGGIACVAYSENDLINEVNTWKQKFTLTQEQNRKD